MNPTFFGKPMRTTKVGCRYHNKRLGVDVHIVQSTQRVSEWRHTVILGPGAWLQSESIFNNPDTAARDAEARVRALGATIRRLATRRSR